jgi:hypothetical protein
MENDKLQDECRRKHKEILRIENKKERELAIALWTIELIDHYQYKPKPLEPGLVKDYRMMNKSAKKQADDRGFWRDGDAAGWLNALGIQKAENNSDVVFLKWCLEILKGREEEEIIQNKLNEYIEDRSIGHTDWQE